MKMDISYGRSAKVHETFLKLRGQMCPHMLLNLSPRGDLV